jgi:tRNA pseudouridine55 synthase
VIDGFLVVDKPAAMTSHDVVARCRRLIGQRRVGHAGTLDPDATGVLLVGLGRATRLMRFVSPLPKTYQAEIVLGVATTTLDASGDVVGRWEMTGVTPQAVSAAAATLTGAILQVPPMVSAIKVGGRRLHEMARAGEEIERAARPVVVHRFDVAATEDPLVYTATVECSSGTYVRSLAADLGTALGGGAHLRCLRRTAIGPFTTDAAVALDDVDESRVLPAEQAMAFLPPIVVAGDELVGVRHGRPLATPNEPASVSEPAFAVLDPDGHLVAVYEPLDGRLRASVVLDPA